MTWSQSNFYFFNVPIALSFLTFLWSEFRHTLKPYNSPLNIRISITEGLLKLILPVILAGTIAKIFGSHTNIHLAVVVCVGASTLRFHRNMAAIILTLAAGYFVAIYSEHSGRLSHLEIAVAIGVLIPMAFKKFLDVLNISVKR